MISVQFTGAQQLSAALRPLMETVQNPWPVLDMVGVLGARACRRNIDRQSSPEGEPFEPTRRGGTILRDTSTLYNGITHSIDGPRSVAIGAGMVSRAYNAYQHFGSQQWNDGEMWDKGPKKGKRKGNPARPFIGISPADVSEIAEDVADFIVRGGGG